MRYTIKFLWFIVFCILLMTAKQINAQETHKIDSLEDRLTRVDDSAKIEILLMLTWEIRNSSFRKAIKYGMQAIELSQKYNDYENLTKAHSFIGVAYRNLGNYSEAINFYLKGLALAKKYKLDDQIGFASINIGNLYIYQKKYNEAETYLSKAFEISEKIENKSMNAYSQLNLGRVMIKKEKYSDALNYINNALQIRISIHDEVGASVCYKYIGDAYFAMKDYVMAMKNYEKTLGMVQESFDKDLLCDVYNNIARAFLISGDYEKALQNANLSLETALKIGTKLRIRNAYITLAQIEESRKKYRKVSEYQKNIIRYNDSLFNNQLAEKLYYIEFINKQNEYEQRLKDQVLIYNAEMNKQKQLMYFAIMLAFALVVVVVVVLLFLRIRQKASAMLMSKNRSIELLNKSLTEERNIFVKGSIVIFNWKNEEKWPVQYVSSNAEDVFGYSPDEFISGGFYYADMISKYDIERVKREVEKACSDNIPYFRHSDYRIIKKDGNEIWLSDFTTIIRNGRNEVTNFLGYVQDITDRKNAEKEIILSKQEAERANRLKSEFLANMSHEIRTPINAVLGFSEVLSSKLGEKNEYKTVIDGIINSANNLIVLINDILDLSKIEAGFLKITPEPVQLTKLVDDIRQMFSVKLSKKSIRFTADIDESLPEFILIDKTHMRQILLNLVGNAIKFTESGSINITFKCKQKTENSLNLLCEITDTGKGIPEDQLNEIFESFTQVEGQSSKFGGTGLGLAITKRLVEAMDGSITVSSQIGKGSIFSVSLNKIIIPDDVEKNRQLMTSEEVPRLRFDSPNILIADDVDVNRNVVRLQLEEYGCNVYEVSNGQEAISFLRKNKADLVIMDVQMPVLDGFNATINIKNDPDLKNIPVVGITAYAFKDEVDKYKKVFDAFLTKPVEMKKVIKTLTRFLPVAEELIEEAIKAETKNYLDELKSYLSKNNQFPVEFVNKYKKDLQPFYRELIDVPDIEDGKKFAQLLSDIGSRYGISAISGFGNQLKYVTEKFQLSNMENLLNQFLELDRLIEINQKG